MGCSQSSQKYAEGDEPPLPPPRPPRKLKRDLIRREDQFKEIDNHALKVKVCFVLIFFLVIFGYEEVLNGSVM